jgi:hypothetical protein
MAKNKTPSQAQNAASELLEEIKEPSPEQAARDLVSSPRDNREIIKHSIATVYLTEAMDRYSIWNMLRKKPQVVKSVISEMAEMMHMVDDVLDNA